MIACLVFLSLSFVDQRDEVKMVRLGAEGKVQGSGDTDDGVDNDDGVDSDIYIMMHVCLFVTKNDHFLLGVSCNHLNPP